MSATESTEGLRRGALELLASGNSVESVAHVFGVPLDVVNAWRDNVRGASDPAAAPAAVDAPRESGYARFAAPLHFDEVLDYSTSTAYRGWMLFLALCMLGMVAAFVVAVLRDRGSVSSGVGLAIVLALVIGTAAFAFLRFARVSLTLDEEGIVVPGAFRERRMPYSDLAGYSIEPVEILAFHGGGIRGEMLRIRSLRPGVAPLEVFIPPQYPMDGDILRRLDEISRANRARHILPPDVAATGGVRDLIARFVVAVAAVSTIVAATPWLRDGLHLWRYRIPALAELQHREGRVTAASRCKRGDSTQVIELNVDGAGVAKTFSVPCVLGDDILMDHEAHRVTIDLDASSRFKDVYQIALDGRPVLDYDVTRARFLRENRKNARFEIAFSLFAMGIMSYFLLLVLRPASRRA